MATTALHGWHPGELAIQHRLGFANAVRDHWSIVRNFMPEQHRVFHTSNLPFIPVTSLDEEGRPWASIVSGPTGSIGFIQSPDARTLSIYARIWDGDPLLNTVRTWISLEDREDAMSERFLTAGLGIEFSTRRRNKFAGIMRRARQVTELDYQIDLTITETTGLVLGIKTKMNICGMIPADLMIETVQSTSTFANLSLIHRRDLLLHTESKSSHRTKDYPMRY